MPDPRDYKLDIKGLPQTGEPDSCDGGPLKPFLGVQFRCCGVYARIYRTSDGSRYAGKCPKCARPVSVAVGAGGTDARFFEAG
jgi:hypothetical protein